MPDGRKYEFNWSLLGNLQEGRPNLGATTRLEIYRLMQFTLRDSLEERFGADLTDEIFYAAGHKAGLAFYAQYLTGASSFDDFVGKLQHALKDLGIGILRLEQADLENGNFTLTIAEDLDCSGLPVLDSEICVYDEGFIAALLESRIGRKFHVKEVDCWCTGDRTCRFRAQVAE